MKSRLLVVTVLLAAWCGAVVVRLCQLQIRDHQLYRQRAESQHHRRVDLQPPRGAIYDLRNRQLALSVEADSVWADPSAVDDAAATARALAKAIGLDADELKRSLVSDREFVWVARQLDRPVASRVRDLDLPGVGFLKESKRYYPMRELAAQVVGFAGVDDRGLEGLEQAYNRVVAGRPVERKVVRDARRGTVLLPTLSFSEAEPGRDLHLTIDAWIQHLLERELRISVEQRQAKGATGVILDPTTGAILAMASVPTFDPNHWTDSPRSSWRNRAVTDAFEPGSTFKLVTAAAALEGNLLDPADRVNCEQGSILIEGVRIHDHKPFGELTFREVITRSSNVGAIKTGLLVGRSGLYRQILEFGFGRATGVDLPGESDGILHPLESWPRRATAYVSFGQGLSVTAIQLAGAFAAIANGGTLYRPFVVARIGQGDGALALKTRPQALGRSVSAATARSLERLLEAVVLEGTGKRAAIPGYRVAGKTGTAQKASASGGYARGRYVASFVGFAPARRPRVVAMIAIDEPNPARGYHGGEVAAPVFSAVVGPTLAYLAVPPERQPMVQWPGQRVAAVPEGPRGELAYRSPASSGGVRLAASRVARGTESAVPDLVGLTARQAVVHAASFGLRVTLHGRGRVRRQAPHPGTAITSPSTPLELWLMEDGER